MTKLQITKNRRDSPYDLEDRTYEFASHVRGFVKRLQRTICNTEDNKKDFRMRIRISRKESKETGYWLRLLDTQGDPLLNAERDTLVQESIELMRIFGAILQKSE